MDQYSHKEAQETKKSILVPLCDSVGRLGYGFGGELRGRGLGHSSFERDERSSGLVAAEHPKQDQRMDDDSDPVEDEQGNEAVEQKHDRSEEVGPEKFFMCQRAERDERGGDENVEH